MKVKPVRIRGTARANRKRGMHLLILALLRPYSKWLLLIFLAMLFEACMNLAIPWPLKIIIDHAIANDPLPSWLAWIPGMESLAAAKLALFAASAFVLVTAAGALAGYINHYFTESVAQNVANDLRIRMYHHLQHLSLSYYDSHQVAKIVNTVTTDVTAIQEFASQTMLRILIDALTITGMLGIMFYLHWDFALIAVAVTPFLLFFVARFKREVKKATREVRRDQTNLAAVLQHGLESIRAVEAFGRQDLEEDKLRRASLDTVAAALKARRLKALLVPVVSTTVAICVGMVLWRGAGLVTSGLMTVGALTVFLAYLSRFFNPVQDLAKLSNNIAQAGVAMERIQMILDADAVIPEKDNAIIPSRLQGHIVFDRVHFAYDGGGPVLENLDLEIRAGQRVGICGPTGSGKSTIASLIARFYDVSAGRILMDGVDVRDYSVDALRMQIAFVLQDTFLFYGTIRENIAYGRPDAGMDEIIAAAKAANAHDFIMQMPHGYDSMVGEHGLTLSGGQRQRIGIARAVVRDSPVLVLDEPTASLDTESESIVIEALEKLMKGKTVIIIAHRLSTIRDADMIVVLKEGRVIEKGSHEELLQSGGCYFDLYHLQTGPAAERMNNPTEKREVWHTEPL